MDGRGSCSCGACQYLFSTEIEFCSYCHCSICRKLTGSAFAAYGEIPVSAFEWEYKDKKTKSFNPTPDTTRYFCGDCGSFLASTHIEATDRIYLSLGCVISGVPETINLEQFFASKAPWHPPNSDQPVHDEWPESISPVSKE